MVLLIYGACLFPGNTVRLVDGVSPWEGRVEVFHNDQWGTICSNNQWDLNDGEVACRQLGLGNAQVVYSNSKFGPGTGPVWLSYVLCGGSEHRLENCSFPSWTSGAQCSQFQHASVKCSE